MENNQDHIETLRKFFTISCATFEFAEKLIYTLNPKKYYIPNTMYELHKIALFELEKPEPNMLLVDELLKEMEDLAGENEKIK